MKFHCADCGQKLEVDAKYSGYGINCPSCSAEISIPKGGPAVSSAEIEEAIRESVGDSAAGGGITIAKFMDWGLAKVLGRNQKEQFWREFDAGR